MDAELTLSLAFLAGLAGAGHCWAMCGGLVGGLFVGRRGGCGNRGKEQLLPHLGYHAGRVLAYTLLGALAAGIGQAIVLTGEVGLAQAVLYVIAGVLVVVSGALAMRGSVGCAARTIGGTNESVRMAHPTARFGVAGFVNGLMPCALVFSLTLKAATAPSVSTGAAWLLVFGLGTVPAMALAAGLAHWLGAQARVWLRRAAGLLVIGLGLQAIWAGYKFFQVMLHL
jgi:sulfite exporter TauE/SafE